MTICNNVTSVGRYTPAVWHYLTLKRLFSDVVIILDVTAYLCKNILTRD